LPFGEGYVDFAGQAASIAVLDQVDRLLLSRHVGAGGLEAGLESADLDVGADYVGNDGDQHRVSHLGQCFCITAGRLDEAPVLAEDVELPAALEAHDARQRIETRRA
jgi:hypothetical protein